MPESKNKITQTLLNHIHTLVTNNGPRPPTRQGERQAADYTSQ